MKELYKIAITGGSGFVGTNLIKYLNSNFEFINANHQNNYCQDEEVLAYIHLAGKAHDLSSSSEMNDYFNVNFGLTVEVFDAFLKSNANVFVTLSSVKAVADHYQGVLTEDQIPYPSTYYGKSKLEAELYILSKSLPSSKRFYILRPCMIHGPGNKGNLNSLYKLLKLGIPWPLGGFENRRSFCSIENLNFVIKELLVRKDIPSGIYNMADDDSISTNGIVKIYCSVSGNKIKILKINPDVVKAICKVFDFLNFGPNTHNLNKLIENFEVSNSKIKDALKKPLPISAIDGLSATFKEMLNS